jgi:SAM-dependent methyltransferase
MFRDGYEKSREIDRESRRIMYGAGSEPAGPIDPIGMVSELQAQLKVRYGERGETTKARERRLREGWFDKYAPEDRSGIDIGCQYDALNPVFRRWDHLFADGDASLMEGVPDQIFHTVYASHVLEHLADPVVALTNGCRILRQGGHLIVLVPHRNLYEKTKTLPSNWNSEHKWFRLPDRAEAPHTLSLEDVIRRADLAGVEAVSLRVLDEGYDHKLPADVHPEGELSIEAILRRS